jgi:pimeloyl-ACP methyl ester carboxylesterase
MGAIISAEFTRRYPEKVQKLALVGPAGFPLKANPLASIIRLPLLGEALMSLMGDQNLQAHNRKYFVRPDQFLEFQTKFALQLKIKGSKRAILSTYRNVPLQNYIDGYDEAAQQRRPVLVIWGMEDMSFPYEHHTALMQKITHAKLVSVPEAAHIPQYEKPELTNAALADFFSERKL